MSLHNVIFLDRDGVINHDSPGYIKNWEEFAFLPGSLAALASLTHAGFHLIIVSNQSIINRGLVPVRVLDRTHHCLRKAVDATGGRIFDIFYCPHRPDENCDCRKPKPGLVWQAALRHGIDVAGSILIGDSARDILCGQNAGCGATILVQTGNGPEAQKVLIDQHTPADVVAADLHQAAQMILDGRIKVPGFGVSNP